MDTLMIIPILHQFHHLPHPIHPNLIYLPPSNHPLYMIRTKNPNHNYQNNMFNPFFMHPRDNPCLALVFSSLNNTNYHYWSCSIKVAIWSENKLRFIDKTVICPTTFNHTQVTSDRCNTTVMSHITNSIESEILESVLWMNTIFKIWQELCEWYH